MIPSKQFLKEDEMSGACGRYGRNEECIQGCCAKPEGNTLLRNLGTDGRIILK
jgi:hypothetical protein